MSRTGKVKPKEIEPDPIYESKLVAKLINIVMKQGKKTIAQKQVYAAFDDIKNRTGKDSLDVFNRAVKNVTPHMEVRSRRVGGAAYQVPTPIKGGRGTSLALRWLAQGARKHPNKQFHTFGAKLAQEILDAANGEGMAFQKKITSHKMAEANKAFAHFRW